MKKLDPTPIDFDSTKKPGHRFSFPDDSENKWTHTLASFSGDPKYVRKIISGEEN